MSKMSELAQVLDDLVSCGEKLIETANTIKEIFSDTAEDAPTKPPSKKNTSEPKKEPVKTYTFADVRKAFSAKSHEGYTEQVKALITKYGANRLSAIKEEDYPAIMAELEVIG